MNAKLFSKVIEDIMGRKEESERERQKKN